MNPIWFLRMAKWARRPPSARTVMLWAGVVAICLAIVLFETSFGWPDALKLNQGGAPRLKVQPISP